MIVRNIEICPACGQWDPWRKVSQYFGADGSKYVYVKCKRCRRKEVIRYLPPTAAAEISPDSGKK